MAEINKAEIMDALHECYDPEIPVNIVDLGLVYDVAINEETDHVDVTMTLTAMGCPMAGEVISEVEMRVGQVGNVKSCKVDLTFDPPWSSDRMTEDAKWELWHDLTSLRYGTCYMRPISDAQFSATFQPLDLHVILFPRIKQRGEKWQDSMTEIFVQR